MYPHPEKPKIFVQPKAEKLVRRGPGDYVLVGRRPDGRAVTIRLTAGCLRLDGLV